MSVTDETVVGRGNGRRTIEESDVATAATSLCTSVGHQDAAAAANADHAVTSTSVGRADAAAAASANTGETSGMRIGTVNPVARAPGMIATNAGTTASGVLITRMHNAPALLHSRLIDMNRNDTQLRRNQCRYQLWGLLGPNSCRMIRGQKLVSH